MTYEECKKAIAVKYQLGTTLVTGHRASYFEEAALLYASQQRTEGIREGFEAAREKWQHMPPLDIEPDRYKSLDDYLNSK